jgi:lipopolysaccharide export system protein LptA
MNRALLLCISLPMLLAAPALADGPDLSQGGPVNITAEDGLDWQQNTQIVTARGDQLTAHYRKKAGAAPAKSGASDDLTGGSEIYRLDADGHVTINTPTDIAFGDKAVYDIDQAVLVMTGQHLMLKTPSEVITARDQLEYWSNERKSVARGDALVVATDGRSVAADILVSYSDPSSPNAPQKPDSSGLNTGQLRRVDAFGHVVLRTQADIVHGDNGVYMPQTGLARVVGNVTITHGLSEIHGQDAVVDLKTGIAHMLPAGSTPIHGLLVPNDHSTDAASTNNGNTGKAKK